MRNSMFSDDLLQFCDSLKIPLLTFEETVQKLPQINIFSSQLFPRPEDWPEHVRLTGFIPMKTNSNPKVSENLLKFLAAGEAPIYMGFGSMPIRSVNNLIQMFSDILIRLKKRGIYCGGWTKVDTTDNNDSNSSNNSNNSSNNSNNFINNENLLIIEGAPHDWLFPQCSMTIHHGGIGTTAASICAGVPTIVYPVWMDQPFWGNLIKNIGIGNSEVIHLKNITPEHLEGQITYALEESVIKKSREFGKQAASEDGITNAAKYLLEFAEKYQYPKITCTWISDDISKCMNSKCSKEFNFFTRKNHCLACGKIFCADCVKGKILPQHGICEQVMCCKDCENVLDAKN